MKSWTTIVLNMPSQDMQIRYSAQRRPRANAIQEGNGTVDSEGWATALSHMYIDVRGVTISHKFHIARSTVAFFPLQTRSAFA
jgi:hypothetical protein